MKAQNTGDPYNMSESNSKARLMVHSNSEPFYSYDRYNSDTKVHLREPVEDPDEVPVEYIIKRHISVPDVKDSSPDNNVKKLSNNGGMMTPKSGLETSQRCRASTYLRRVRTHPIRI